MKHQNAAATGRPLPCPALFARSRHCHDLVGAGVYVLHLGSRQRKLCPVVACGRRYGSRRLHPQAMRRMRTS